MKKVLLLCAMTALICSCDNSGRVAGDDSDSIYSETYDSLEGVDMKFGRVELGDSCTTGIEALQEGCIADYSLAYVVPKGPNDSVATSINNSIIDLESYGLMGDLIDTTGISTQPIDFIMRTIAAENIRMLFNAYLSDVKTITAGVTQAELESQSWQVLNYAYSRDSHFNKGMGHTLFYSRSSYSYTGGAHGTMLLTTLNFDLRTGKPLYFKDVFNIEKDVEMRKVIQNQLLFDVSLDMERGITSLEELNGLGYNISELIPQPTTFILSELGITFIYQVYEIAAYALGEQVITIPYDQMTDFLTDTAKDAIGL